MCPCAVVSALTLGRGGVPAADLFVPASEAAQAAQAAEVAEAAAAAEAADGGGGVRGGEAAAGLHLSPCGHPAVLIAEGRICILCESRGR